MKVSKLKVNNFQGLKGIHEFDFGKITALAQPNGSGKTSLINALRWGLTGVEPKGDMITKGEKFASVLVEFENGNSFIRQKFAQKGKASRYFVDNASTTLKKFNEYISYELGGLPINTAKLISSGELLSNLSSQELGTVLLQYLPESMTTKIVLERFPEATPTQVEIIKKELPESEFGIEALNEFYDLIYDRRRLAKQFVAQKKAVLESLGDEHPGFTPEELKEKIAEVSNNRDELLKKNENFKHYQEIAQKIKEKEEFLKALEPQILELEKIAKEHNDSEFSLIESHIKDAMENSKTIEFSMGSLMQSKQNLDLAIDNISKPFCPLSEKIICTVDKTPVLEELKQQREKIIEDGKELKNSYLSIKEKIEQLNKQRADMIAENNAFIQLAGLLKQKEQLLAQEYTLPEKPENIEDLSGLNEELNRLQNLIPIVENFNKRDDILHKLREGEAKLADYEILVQAFSPKGSVKEAIMSYYMDEFSNFCNDKAKELFPNMTLKFVTDNGVKILTDTSGNGEYIEFPSLSGGEKASVMFLMVSMLSSLSGMKIIILDELSVLDDDVFANLIKVLKENEAEYDMCLLAAVDHTDTLNTLSEYNIPILSVNQVDKEECNVVSESSDVSNDVQSNNAVESSESVTTSEVEEEPNEVYSSEAVVEEELSLHEEDNNETSEVEVVDDFSHSEDIVEDEVTTESQLEQPAFSEVSSENLEQMNDSSKRDYFKQLIGAIEKTDLRFEDDGSHDEFEEEPKVNDDALKRIEELGLLKGVNKTVIDFMRARAESDGQLYMTNKEIAEETSVSQPTVGKIVKTLREENLLEVISRGVYVLKF